MVGQIAIKTRQLRFKYPSGIQALKGVDLDVPEGVMAALIGPNGSGKTTLLLNIAGILKGEGLIEVFGLDPRKDRRIRRLVGVVFQNPEDQVFNLTVYDEVAYTPRSMGLEEDEVEKLVDEALKAVGIEHLRDRGVLELSYGELKKVALASAIVHKPRLLLLDEPTLGLDYKSKEEFMGLLKSLKGNMTIFAATHDLEFIHYFDVVYVMNDGVVVAWGKPDEIVFEVERYGLKPPKTAELARKLGIKALTIEEILDYIRTLINRCKRDEELGAEG